jgi:hypothetical protein
MTCFTHNEKASIGSCRQCLRHLCIDCIEMIENCVCCHDLICHQRMREERAIIERSKNIYAIGDKAKRKITANSLFLTLLGIIFIVWGGYMMWFHFDLFFLPLIGMGLVFTCYGLYNIFRKDRLNY